MIDKPDYVGENTVVSLDYILSVNGEIVDSTTGQEPIQFVHGHSQLIPALERELDGMMVGESKDIFIPAEQGYGEYDPDMLVDVERSQFPEGFVFVLAGQLKIQDTSGKTFDATIMGIGPERVQLDLNHPLAGKDLMFQATVVDLRHATPDEIDSGSINP